MKKFIILFTTTILTIITIFCVGNPTDAAVKASVLKIGLTDGENIITATGRLQYFNEQSIKCENYMLVDKVYQNDGDYVQKGQPIMYVYEIPSSTVTTSFPELSEYLKLISGTVLTDDIVQEIKKYAAQRTISSPVDGIVTSLSFKKDQIAVKGNILFKIADKKTRCLKASVNEGYIEKIKINQNVRIRFSAISNKTYNGKVCAIASEAKQTGSLTGKETTVEVTIKLENSDERLKIGYTAECSIITSIDKSIVKIPYEYIRSDSKGDYVFKKTDNRAIKTYIKTGNEYKNGVCIKNGLKENDTIVMPGQNIEDGIRVI